MDYSLVGTFRRRRCPIAPHRRRLIEEALAVVELGRQVERVNALRRPCKVARS
jgi:hypothetical protein